MEKVMEALERRYSREKRNEGNWYRKLRIPYLLQCKKKQKTKKK